MYLRRFSVTNLRSIAHVTMDFKAGEEAGWHVILGSNGSGKSSLVRAFALIMMGEREAYAARQEFQRWIRSGEEKSVIDAQISGHQGFDDLSRKGPWSSRPITLKANIEISERHRPAEVKFTGIGMTQTIWGGGDGWFAASFGPFRRFTGGDNKYDRLFITNKRLASHLTALGEDVALTDASKWLSTLHSRALQEEKSGAPQTSTELLHAVWDFLDKSGFFPRSEEVAVVSDDTILLKDGNGFLIDLEEMSDGYRSALSLVLELLRQMVELYGVDRMLRAIDSNNARVDAPGVVFIDEVDVHLHPTWQRDIGRWLTKCFPKVQFLVTTHSPIVCRAVANEEGEVKGTIWKLPTLGSDETFRKVVETEFDQLVFGDVLDAFSTELFGKNIIRSAAGENHLKRLAELNIKALDIGLTGAEAAERKALRRAFPMAGGSLRVSDA